MKKYLSATAAAALLAAAPATAFAQNGQALGDTTIQPMQVTCSDWLEASDDEQDRLAFFILGFSEASMSADAGGHLGTGDGMTTGAIGSPSPGTQPRVGTDGTAAAGVDDTQAPAILNDGPAAAGVTGTDVPGVNDTTTAGVAGAAGESLGSPGELPETGDTAAAAQPDIQQPATGTADTAGVAPGAEDGLDAGGADVTAQTGLDQADGDMVELGQTELDAGGIQGSELRAGAEMDGTAGAGMAGEQQVALVSRDFFGTDIEELRAACEDNGDRLVHQVMFDAQMGARIDVDGTDDADE